MRNEDFNFITANCKSLYILKLKYNSLLQYRSQSLISRSL